MASFNPSSFTTTSLRYLEIGIRCIDCVMRGTRIHRERTDMLQVASLWNVDRTARYTDTGVSEHQTRLLV
jgi:hypothetical protein